MLKLEHKQETKNRNSGENKEEGIKKKGKNLPPHSRVALNENPNMRKDSVEGRMVVVLLKGLYL